MTIPRIIALIALGAIAAGCPRADAPEQPDTALVDPPASVQFPPAEATGDTGQRAPTDHVATPEVVPRPGATPTRPPPTVGPAPDAPRPAPEAAVTDSVRGRMSIVGAAPVTHLVIRGSGEPDTRLHGDAAMNRSLRSVQGLEIEAFGHLEAGVLHVERFAVRGSDGVPAVDGMLQRDDDDHVLVTADGRRHRVTHLPESLHAHVGRRVWIAGALDRPPEAFGVID